MIFLSKFFTFQTKETLFQDRQNIGLERNSKYQNVVEFDVEKDYGFIF